MSKNIGVGLISFAHGHQIGWSDVFSKREDARVVAAWDDDEARGRQQAERLGVPFVPRLDELLARDDVDAVTICSENAKHAEHACKAAQAGKHIMMQKPMATSVDEARAIVEAVNRAGVTYMQAYNLRFDPLHLKVKELVDGGAIGKVTMVRRRHSHHFGLTKQDTKNVLGWMADGKLSGGGALMDEGAHALLWYLWMFGRPKSVSALISTTMDHLDVDDHALLTMEFEEGVVGTLQTSWIEWAGGPAIEIYGDQGVIIAAGTDIASSRVMPDNFRCLQVYRRETEAWEYPEVELVLARTVPPANAFIDTLVQGKPSPVPAETAMAAVKIAMAAYESAKTGRTVKL